MTTAVVLVAVVAAMESRGDIIKMKLDRKTAVATKSRATRGVFTCGYLVAT